MELAKLFENYKSVNLMEDATERDWCIVPASKKIQQVTLDVDGKQYNYACRYDAHEEDVAIIGYGFPAYSNAVVESSPNTGKMTNVRAVNSTLTIKRTHAVEIDYLFSPKADKKMISQCVKFLSMDEQNYPTTLQFDKGLTPIRPIRYYIQRVLSAASILSHPNFVTEEEIQIAKKEIFEYKKMDSEMNNWVMPSLDIGVDLSDIQICDLSVLNVFKLLEGAFDSRDWEPTKGVMYDCGSTFNEFVALKEANDFVNKYSHIGAISIMVRGGFVNLLKAYLSVNPPIAEYRDDICQMLDGIGYNEALEILKAYRS